MVKYNYKNLADESNFSSQVYRAGMFDKILGISKTAKEAASQVIAKMGDDLKAEARKVAQDEVKKIEGKMLNSAEEKAVNSTSHNNPNRS